MRRSWILRLSIALVVAGPLAGAAGAGGAADEAVIRARLQNWADAFNGRDAEAACELFADDVLSTVRGAPDAGKAAICDRLRQALARSDAVLSYTPDIEEVLVAGDLAAVRLTWTLKIARNGTVAVSQERGMDLFRRDPDGAWRIFRFIAFSTEKDE
jgi:steroid delta-isomerase